MARAHVPRRRLYQLHGAVAGVVPVSAERSVVARAPSLVGSSTIWWEKGLRLREAWSVTLRFYIIQRRTVFLWAKSLQISLRVSAATGLRHPQF